MLISLAFTVGTLKWDSRDAKRSGRLCGYVFEDSITNLNYDEHCDRERGRTRPQNPTELLLKESLSLASKTTKTKQGMNKVRSAND